MSPSPQPPQLPSADDRDIYRLFRDQIVAEDNLVNHRMTWLLLTHAFLLAILAGVLALGPERVEEFKWLIAITGMSTSVLIGTGILAAQNAISYLKHQYRDMYQANPPKNVPPITGNDFAHLMGLLPLVLPIVCFLVWIVIGCSVHAPLHR